MDNFVAEAPIIRSFVLHGRRVVTLNGGGYRKAKSGHTKFAYKPSTYTLKQGDKEVMLEGDLERMLCRAIFCRVPKALVTWIDIFFPDGREDDWDGTETRRQKRRMRDAKRRLNERIEREFGIVEFIHYINGDYFRK